MVAGTASSLPAWVISATSAVEASGLLPSLVMPTTAAPLRLAHSAVSTISWVAPDWLIATTSEFDRSRFAPYSVATEGAASDACRPAWISVR